MLNDITAKSHVSKQKRTAPEALFAADASFLRGCISIGSAEIPTQKKTYCSNKHATIPE